MEQLIKIQEREGQQVVSARDLHEFLGSKQQFADWIKGRISKYGLIENQDYTTFHNFMNRSKTTEYALTIDAAKELAMVEGNDKGKAARQYFIEAEKQLRAVTQQTALSTEQVLLQQAYAIVDLRNSRDSQQEQINQLQADVQLLLQNKRPAPQPKRLRGASSPARQALIQKINQYCTFYRVSHQETWTFLYKRLRQLYHVDVYGLRLLANETLVDAIERYGHIDRLYSLVCAELNYTE